MAEMEFDNQVKMGNNSHDFNEFRHQKRQYNLDQRRIQESTSRLVVQEMELPTICDPGPRCEKFLFERAKELMSMDEIVFVVVPIDTAMIDSDEGDVTQLHHLLYLVEIEIKEIGTRPSPEVIQANAERGESFKTALVQEMVRAETEEKNRRKSFLRDPHNGIVRGRVIFPLEWTKIHREWEKMISRISEEINNMDESCGEWLTELWDF